MWQDVPGRHRACAALAPPHHHPPHLPPAPICWWRLRTHPALSPIDHNYAPSGSTPRAQPNINPCTCSDIQSMNMCVCFFSRNNKTKRTFVYVWIHMAFSKYELQTWSLLWEATSCSRACCCSDLALTSSCTRSSSWHLSASGSCWNRYWTKATWDRSTCRSFCITKRRAKLFRLKQSARDWGLNVWVCND